MSDKELQAIREYTKGEYLKDDYDESNRQFGRYCEALLKEVDRLRAKVAQMEQEAIVLDAIIHGS